MPGGPAAVLHPDSELFDSGRPRGYGARALKPIPVGTIVWTLCALDQVLGPAALERLGPAYRGVVEHFSYRDHRGHHVLCWDAGRYVNHSCRPSMRGLGPWAQIAVADIPAGGEITCDYGECNLSAPLDCACGEDGCRGRIAADDVRGLAVDWDREVRTAVVAAAGIAQPLRPFWRDPSYLDAILAGELLPPSTLALHFDPDADGERRVG